MVYCKKETKNKEEIPQSAIDKILALGFSTENLQKVDKGYPTEGDIVLTDSDLGSKPQIQFLRIAGNEQYRTFNLITALPRTLTVSLSNQFSFIYGGCS